MPKLNYPSRSHNGRKFEFSDWNQYAKTLGYLMNRNHYRNIADGNIRIIIEHNQNQGAHSFEVRLHFFNDENLLMNEFPTFYDARVRENTSGTRVARVNREDYFLSLIDNYNFTREYTSTHVEDIEPPDITNNYDNIVLQIAENINTIHPNTIFIQDFISNFNYGYSL